MRLFFSKSVLIVIVIFVLLATGVYVIWGNFFKPVPVVQVETNLSSVRHSIIGNSVKGRQIEAFSYGNGNTHIIFVGGVHGGYEWNSVLLAYQFIDYLATSSDILPKNLTVTVIPSLNPDGIFNVTGKEGRFNIADVNSNLPLGTGRLNSNNVDLNRNFACKWQATSTWQNKPESGGLTVFSEPEAKAIKDFILKENPAAVIFWHSKSNAVYASQCEKGILPVTLDIMNTYSKASGYPAVKFFDSYAVTGAAEDWLASINIPAITVELQTHETVEWNKNFTGIKAVLEYFRNR